jgi:hypothetical protein
MEEIIYYLMASFCWILFYQLYLVKAIAKKSVSEWKIWAMSDDGQNTLVEILGQDQGVIDHIAHACGKLIRSQFEGGFGAVAKKLGNTPEVAMQTGIAKELKNMKWYESALLMKVANQIPELQPLLGLAEVVKRPQEGKKQPPKSLQQGQNL